MSPSSSERLDVDALYDRLARPVLALAANLTGDRDLAEDVLQETFLAAHRARARFRGEASPETWLWRIAIHASLRARRRRSRRRDVERAVVAGRNGVAGEPAPSRGDGGPDADELRREQARRLHAAMDRLSEEHRVVLSLTAVRELPGRAVADILGMPEGTVHSRAHAARGRLREILRTDGDRRRA